MADVQHVQVELGFVEKSQNNLSLSSPFFPSKVGGKPAWLDLGDLPEADELLCKTCKKPFVFLLQIYSPSCGEGDEPATEQRCFHRTIFVFCCRNGNCYKKNASEGVFVLRCQLPRENTFYSFNAPPEIHEDSKLTWDSLDEAFRPKTVTTVCSVCGCRGEKKCSKCRSVFYCGRDHQITHWKSGHKEVCSKFQEAETNQGLSSDACGKCLFPEFEILTEDEPPEEVSEERSEEERMNDYESISKQLEGRGVDSTRDQELERLASGGKQVQDKEFKNFKKRIERSPSQVLRFARGGEPLWVSGEHQPQGDDIPKCPCGSHRQFEFQIMPQLLYYLQVDTLENSIDWGTIAIYTCTQNCDQGSTYHEEFAWKQDFTDTGLPGTAI